MDKPEILFKKEEGIATITLNCPERKNSFSMDMIDQWANALGQWRSDPEVKVIVLTGSGDSFCSGAYLAPSPAGAATAPTAFDQKSNLWEQNPSHPSDLGRYR